MDYIVHNVTRIYDMSAIDISDDQDMNNLSTKIQVYAMENTTEGWVLQMESFGYMDRWYTEKQAEIPGMEKMPGEHIITLDDHINRGQSGMEMWFATDGGHMGILQSTWSLHNWFVKEVYKPDQNTQIDALMTMPGPDGQTFVYTGGDGTIAKYVLTPHN